MSFQRYAVTNKNSLGFAAAYCLAASGNARQFDQMTFENLFDSVGRTLLRELSDAAVVQSETQIFAVNPAISFPAKEWIDTDLEFWKPRAK